MSIYATSARKTSLPPHPLRLTACPRNRIALPKDITLHSGTLLCKPLLTPTDADNYSGSIPAACNDWRIGDADPMSARTTPESTSNTGKREARVSQKVK